MLASYRQIGNRLDIVLHIPPSAVRISKTIAILAAVSSVLAATGCGGNDAALGQARGLKCVDDTNVCISQRKDVFNSYMADRSRAWVRQPAGPHEYASEVRLHGLQQEAQGIVLR